MDTGEDGYQETAGESGTGSLTSKKKEYGMIFGLRQAVLWREDWQAAALRPE